uniref:Uncharacterized protein n=1 Tax=viral metagenome TaxID=1070528 RepID=A0A6H2A2B9_9ZZZZ
MKDGQDGIDFLFNAMFDKEILSVMRPILAGGINNVIDDYIRPGEFKQVTDVNQIKELDYKGADLTAFRVLKELQDRQHFISVDTPSMNVQRQQRTATEVDSAAQAAERLNSVFGVMIKDSIIQKARLRAGTIQQYLIKSPNFKQFTIENTKLMTDPSKMGKRLVRITETPAPQQKLEAENKFIPGNSEIFEVSPKRIRDFELSISVKAPSNVEKRLKSAKDIAFWNEAKQRPDIFETKEAAKDFAEAMGKDPERMLAKEGQAQPLAKGMGEEIPKENTPPSLQSLISQQIPQTIQ